MPVRPAIAPRIAATAVMGAAMAVILEVVRPFSAGPVGFDSAASVLHFERILSGQRLEAFVAATPKPLLTGIYGVVHALGDDWRLVWLVSLLAYGAGVALAALLAWRVGGIGAGAFVGTAIVGSPLLILDVAAAYAVPWAMLGWAAAGLALSSSPAR